MPRKPQPGSLASEAARLTSELSDLFHPVTIEMVRWWKKKKYPLDDTRELRKCLRNQERKPNPKKPGAPHGNAVESSTLAYRLITDEMVIRATENVTVGQVLDYLRDAWEAEEWHSARYANKSEAEMAEMVQRNIKSAFASLPDLLGVDVPGAREVMREIFPLG